MLYVLIIVESRRWVRSILGVFLEVSTDSRRRHLWKDFFLKTKILEKSPARVFFFVWIYGIFEGTCLAERKRLFLYCFGTTIIINI